MDDRVTIAYDGSNTIDVSPGRALRLAGEAYPLFRAPDPASVSDPDVCLDFLKTLHLSLCPVFDIGLRRWMSRYFDAVLSQADAHADALLPVAGLDPANAHRAWCYAAHRPLSNVSFELDGARHEAPVMFWLDDGPLLVRFSNENDDPSLRTVVMSGADLAAPDPAFLAGMGHGLAEYWQGVAAPRHPFVRSALSGLSGLTRGLGSQQCH